MQYVNEEMQFASEQYLDIEIVHCSSIVKEPFFFLKIMDIGSKEPTHVRSSVEW